jgi:WD domain, G-beta repeat
VQICNLERDLLCAPRTDLCMDVTGYHELLSHAGGADHTVQILDLERNLLSASLTGHSKKVTSLAFPTPTTLLSASADKTVKLWSAGGGAGTAPDDLAWAIRDGALASAAAGFAAVCVHPVPSLAVAAAADATWQLLDIEAGRRMSTGRAEGARSLPLTCSCTLFGCGCRRNVAAARQRGGAARERWSHGGCALAFRCLARMIAGHGLFTGRHVQPALFAPLPCTRAPSANVGVLLVLPSSAGLPGLAGEGVNEEVISALQERKRADDRRVDLVSSLAWKGCAAWCRRHLPAAGGVHPTNTSNVQSVRCFAGFLPFQFAAVHPDGKFSTGGIDAGALPSAKNSHNQSACRLRCVPLRSDAPRRRLLCGRRLRTVQPEHSFAARNTLFLTLFQAP